MGGARVAAGDVALVGEPRSMAPRSLPGHRILTAVVVNASGGPLEIDARDFTVRDAGTADVHAAVQFDGVGHAKVVQLPPGGEVVIAASWRGEAAAELRCGDERIWAP